MNIILKIGGSLLFSNEGIKVELIKRWVDVIRKLRDAGHHIGVVIGGGKPAREFAGVASELGANQSYQDFIGIEAARQNARLFISALPEAYPHPPRDYQELIALAGSEDLLIVGGFQPGQSTNAVAAIFAEYIKADYLFNLTNISHVYDKDPDEFSDAIKFDKIDYDTFSDIIMQNEQGPGKYELFDVVGLTIVARSRIKLVFLNGNIPEFVFDVINGNNKGTIVYE